MEAFVVCIPADVFFFVGSATVRMQKELLEPRKQAADLKGRQVSPTDSV